MTGVTTFLLRHEIDTGDILLQREVPILPEDSAGSLHDRMMHVGAGLVLATVDQLANQQARPLPQRDAFASYAPKIFHGDARMDWSRPSNDLNNFIRGMSPSPGAWTLLDDQEWKILAAKPTQEIAERPSPGNLLVHQQRFFAAAADGWLEVLEVQLSGKRRMSAREFLNGYRIKDWRAK